MQRLLLLSDCSSRTACLACFSKWIAFLDYLLITVVDQGSNPAALRMATNLQQLESEVYLIRTEAPWPIAENERSVHLLSKLFDTLLCHPEYTPSPQLQRLVVKSEMARKLAQ